MEIYSTEEQQVEAIKSFWSKYGSAIIGGVVVGLAGIYGWNWYQQNEAQAQEAQSKAYEKSIAGLAAQANVNTANVEQFIQTQNKSGYATLAALQLAKSYIEEKQLDKAITQLDWVVNNTADNALKDLATYRLARVLIANEQADKALNLVAKPTTEAFTAQFAEVRGDINLQKGDLTAARTAYQLAADEGGLAGNPGLKMKLDNLAQDNGTVSL